ncbi:MAG: hypothetical protein RLZZ612_1777, partial [Pseudomonadota bacterium]
MTTDDPNTDRLALASWCFQPINLGCLTNNTSVIEFKPLTLICGKNNTGKTWAMYALYAFLGRHLQRLQLPGIDDLLKELEQKGQVTWNIEEWAQEHGDALLKSINDAVASNLAQVFNGDPDLFKKTRFEWDVNTEELIRKAIDRPFQAKLALGRDETEILLLKKDANANEILIVQNKNFLDIKGFISFVVTRHFIGLPNRTTVFL